MLEINWPAQAQEFDALFRDLAEQGYSIQDDQLSADLVTALHEEAQLAWNAGEFHQARIGTPTQPKRQAEIRGDSIRWLEENTARPAQRAFLNWTERLRHELNATFYLGLKRSEFHFARYAPGDGYVRHLDQHKGQPHRRITLILYITQDRQPADGGELVIYSPENPEREILRVAPQTGRLVLFRSELLPHAVLPAVRTRWSVSGWFRDDLPELRL